MTDQSPPSLRLVWKTWLYASAVAVGLATGPLPLIQAAPWILGMGLVNGILASVLPLKVIR